MAQIMAAVAPKRKRVESEVECLREVHAQLISLGGAVILAICIVMTLVLLMVLMLPTVTGFQLVILAILTGSAWVYFLDSCTEKLRLIDHSVEFTALFSRTRHIPLIELQSMILVHEGFNLERGMESIEFRRAGRKPDRVALGPCWQRNKLEAFLHSVEEALSDPHLLKEVR